MSLASVYAASQASADATKATATASVPAAFVGPNGRADVTPEGNMRLTQTTSGSFDIPAAGALAFRDWITTTFG
jgi:hypothetical protein